MKFGNAILLIITSTIILYAIFLFAADFNLIQEKISNFKINYLPLILEIKLTAFENCDERSKLADSFFRA